MSFDLTIESALADPMIRAVMRADRVEPHAFETMLRRVARNADHAAATPLRAPAALVAQAARAISRGCCCA